MTRADILSKNVDLIEHAGKLLASGPVVQMTTRLETANGDTLKVHVAFQNIDRLDFYRDGHPLRSEPLSAEAADLAIEVARNGARALQLQGFRNGKLVAAARLTL
jgi:hypothetical protein